MNLIGKTAIVTGAAQGIGQQYARRMYEMGMNVVAADVSSCDETVDAMYGPGKAFAAEMDVTDFEQVEKVVAKTVEEYGGVDVLVNNAALYGTLKGGRIEDIDSDQWDACMNVNVKGIWNTSRAVIPHMRTGGGGSIINISSLAAVYGLPFALHYSASKAAVIGMTRAMARELGRDWIRVNAVGPSAVVTPGTEQFFGDKKDKALQVVKAGQALQANLEPEDLVGTILYLASDASKFVTGQTIMVDGGTTFL